MSHKEFYIVTLQFIAHLNIRKVFLEDYYVIDVGYSRKGKRALNFGQCAVQLRNLYKIRCGDLQKTIEEIEKKYVPQDIIDLNLSEFDKNKLRNIV